MAGIEAMRTTGLTKSQQARRARMVEAATRLAAEGGYDAVQMREVAAEADVALGTLYRYFPSKEYLLVWVMRQEMEKLVERMSERPPQGDTPVERLVDVMGRANRALQRQPKVSAAMVRALVSGETEIASVVSRNREMMSEVIAVALATPELTREQEAAVEVLAGVWLSALVGWIGGVTPASAVTTKLEEAARLVL